MISKHGHGDDVIILLNAIILHSFNHISIILLEVSPFCFLKCPQTIVTTEQQKF